MLPPRCLGRQLDDALVRALAATDGRVDDDVEVLHLPAAATPNATVGGFARPVPDSAPDFVLIFREKFDAGDDQFDAVRALIRSVPDSECPGRLI